MEKLHYPRFDISEYIFDVILKSEDHVFRQVYVLEDISKKGSSKGLSKEIWTTVNYIELWEWGFIVSQGYFQIIFTPVQK